MKYYYRALLSVYRNTSKYISYFIIILFLTIGISLSFNIKQSFTKVISNIQDAISKQVVLDIYIDEVSDDTINKFISETTNSPYVKGSSKILRLNENIVIKDHNQYVGKVNADDKLINYSIFEGVEAPSLPMINDKIARIKSGRFFTEDEYRDNSKVIIVSSEFANLNNLKINDELSIEVSQYTQSYYDYITENKTINNDIVATKIVLDNFKIVGIIDIDLNKINISKDNELLSNSINIKHNFILNTFYLPYSQLQSINNLVNEYNVNKMNNMTVLYEVEDYQNITLFHKELSNKLKSNKAFDTNSSEIISDIESVESNVKAINTFTRLSNIAFYSLIFISMILLTFISTMMVKEREFEFGLYLALGERTNRIITQLVIELCLVGTIAISLATTLSIVIQPTINKVINNNINVIQSTTSTDINEYIYTNSFDTELIDNINIDLSLSNIFITYLILITMIIIGTIIPSLIIKKYNPKDILM